MIEEEFPFEKKKVELERANLFNKAPILRYFFDPKNYLPKEIAQVQEANFVVQKSGYDNAILSVNIDNIFLDKRIEQLVRLGRRLSFLTDDERGKDLINRLLFFGAVIHETELGPKALEIIIGDVAGYMYDFDQYYNEEVLIPSIREEMTHFLSFDIQGFILQTLQGGYELMEPKTGIQQDSLSNQIIRANLHNGSIGKGINADPDLRNLLDEFN